MKLKSFVFYILITAFFSVSGQEKKKSYPKAIEQNIKQYNAYSNLAYENGDFEKGKFLFDTLVNNQLVGTKFQDYNLKKIYGGKLKLSSIKKPIVIQTYSAWCVLNRGEAIALNKISKKYAKKIQIIVLFWDKKKDAKAIANQFNSYIEVCYANESYGRDEPVLANMKYAIGFLSTYYLDKNLNVININKGALKPLPPKTSIKECVKYNFDNNEKYILEMLTKI